MQTYARPDAPQLTTTSTMALYAGDGMRATGAEVDFRTHRLLAEAARDHGTAGRAGLRHLLGHALVAVGRAVHGLEPEPPARPALDAR